MFVKERRKENTTCKCWTIFNPEFTDLGILLRKLLEHVGVDLFVLFMVFLDLVLADDYLSASCLICGVDL